MSADVPREAHERLVLELANARDDMWARLQACDAKLNAIVGRIESAYIGEAKDEILADIITILGIYDDEEVI